jgi:hypothetical protein
MKQSKVLSKKEKKETERKMWLKFQSSIKFPNRIEWSEEKIIIEDPLVVWQPTSFFVCWDQ